VLRDAIDLAREEAHRLEEEVGIEAARGARCVAYLLRKRLAKEQPLRRLADETPDTTADTFAGGSYLTAEHDTLGMIAARHGGDRLAWEMANPWVTSSAMVLPAGLRVAIPAQAGPAAGARQDGEAQ